MGLFKKKRNPDDPPEMGSLEHKLQVTRRYLAMWQKYFSFFSESLVGRKILPEEEKEFSKYVYQLALEHFMFTKLVGGDFHASGKIVSILDACVSLSHLKNMPDATFASLQVNWHEVFIEINKTLGFLMEQIPPEPIKKNKDAGIKVEKNKAAG